MGARDPTSKRNCSIGATAMCSPSASSNGRYGGMPSAREVPPRKTVTPLASCSGGNSSSSRLLPTPGGPLSKTTEQCPARASASCSDRMASSRSRPISGERPRRGSARIGVSLTRVSFDGAILLSDGLRLRAYGGQRSSHAAVGMVLAPWTSGITVLTTYSNSGHSSELGSGKANSSKPNSMKAADKVLLCVHRHPPR